MKKEIELKLDLTDAGADLLVVSGLLDGDPLVAHLHSIYFDTADEALAAAGFSLRIRHTGDARTQNVKAVGARTAGFFARPEWERAVADDTPILDGHTPIRSMLGAKADAITPLFEVRVERRTWVLTQNNATIEAVFDRGEIQLGDRCSKICEVELELKRGDISALFALARRLDTVAPLRLGARSKSERGYALVSPVATAFGAEPVTMHPDMSTQQAFQAIVLSCVRHFRLNEDLLLWAHQTEPLHQARVALRRLRTAFAIFGPLLGDGVSTKLATELRWLTTGLGDARNIDVLLEHAPPDLRDRLLAGRHNAYAALDEALASKRSRTLMLDIIHWAVAGDWLSLPDRIESRSQPVRIFAATALRRARRRLEKKGRGLKEASDRERHEVRKDAKTLRYAAEFFGNLTDGNQNNRRRHRFLAALEHLQNELGALNDMVMAPQLLANLGIHDQAGAGMLMTEHNKRRLIARAYDGYAKLLAAKRYWYA
jgi:inorganic triphosphatase YgiF